MDMEDRFSQERAYGCLRHYRFRHPDTGEWVQVTRLAVAQAAQAFRYCGMRWNVQWVSCDQCEESNYAARYAPLPMSDMQVHHSAV